MSQAIINMIKACDGWGSIFVHDIVIHIHDCINNNMQLPTDPSLYMITHTFGWVNCVGRLSVCKDRTIPSYYRSSSTSSWVAFVVRPGIESCTSCTQCRSGTTTPIIILRYVRNWVHYEQCIFSSTYINLLSFFPFLYQNYIGYRFGMLHTKKSRQYTAVNKFNCIQKTMD